MEVRFQVRETWQGMAKKGKMCWVSLSLSPVCILQCQGLVVSLLSLFKQHLTCISEPKFNHFPNTPCVFEWLIIVIIITVIIFNNNNNEVIFSDDNKDSDGDNQGCK